jgi:hypothetical protein
MTSVSSRLQRRVADDFTHPGSVEEVIRLLTEASDSERVQAAIVFAGELAEIKHAVELAAIDWRDALVNGDLANDNWQSRLDAELRSDQTS